LIWTSVMSRHTFAFLFPSVCPVQLSRPCRHPSIRTLCERYSLGARWVCSGLQGDQTPRYLSKCLLHRFRCCRYFLFQDDFSCFIQNTVERPAISQIHTDRQLLLLENFVTKYLHSA